MNVSRSSKPANTENRHRNNGGNFFHSPQMTHRRIIGRNSSHSGTDSLACSRSDCLSSPPQNYQKDNISNRCSSSNPYPIRLSPQKPRRTNSMTDDFSSLSSSSHHVFPSLRRHPSRFSKNSSIPSLLTETDCSSSSMNEGSSGTVFYDSLGGSSDGTLFYNIDNPLLATESIVKEVSARGNRTTLAHLNELSSPLPYVPPMPIVPCGERGKDSPEDDFDTNLTVLAAYSPRNRTAKITRTFKMKKDIKEFDLKVDNNIVASPRRMPELSPKKSLKKALTSDPSLEFSDSNSLNKSRSSSKTTSSGKKTKVRSLDVLKQENRIFHPSMHCHENRNCESGDEEIKEQHEQQLQYGIQNSPFSAVSHSNETGRKLPLEIHVPPNPVSRIYSPTTSTNSPPSQLSPLSPPTSKTSTNSGKNIISKRKDLKSKKNSKGINEDSNLVENSYTPPPAQLVHPRSLLSTLSESSQDISRASIEKIIEQNNATMVEISSGQYVHMLQFDQILDLILDSTSTAKLIQCKCTFCSTSKMASGSSTFWSIGHVDFVICPSCDTVFPLEVVDVTTTNTTVESSSTCTTSLKQDSLEKNVCSQGISMKEMIKIMLKKQQNQQLLQKEQE